MFALRQTVATAAERRALPRRPVAIPAYVGRKTHNPRLAGYRFGTIVDLSDLGLGLYLELRPGTLGDVLGQLSLVEVMFPCPGTGEIVSLCCRIRHMGGEDWSTRAGAEVIGLSPMVREALCGWDGVTPGPWVPMPGAERPAARGRPRAVRGRR